jgi:ATPase subunit of ABC transporter with duplicated ATPase domains
MEQPFLEVSMMQSFLSFKSVSFYYPSSVVPVLENISFDLHSGWTGVSGKNGSGKSTLLLLASGLLAPASGSVKIPKPLIYCDQRTDEIPSLWEDFFYANDNHAGYLMDRLKIEGDWAWRWDSLSHGERKRMQLAIALWQNPEMLLVDEPSNHLDTEAKTLIKNALKEFSGIGLIVSHDRFLLDELCHQCIFVASASLVLRPGGITQGLKEEEREQQEGERIWKKFNDEKSRLQTEALRRKRIADDADKKLSKKHLDPKDSDARGKINLAKLTNKDAVMTKLYQRMETRVSHLDKKISGINIKTEGPRGIRLQGSEAKMDRFFLLEEGGIELGNGKTLSHPPLVMRPGDAIGLTGLNGSGKSTLLRQILSRIPESISYLYIPQEITIEESKKIISRFLAEDEKYRGEVISRFARLGSVPENLLQSALPSPGEIRKLLIAEAVFKEVSLIIMDEPSNHLDLPSTLLLEDALLESHASLLLISHDEVFLHKLINKEWHISSCDENVFRLEHNIFERDNRND